MYDLIKFQLLFSPLKIKPKSSYHPRHAALVLLPLAGHAGCALMDERPMRREERRTDGAAARANLYLRARPMRGPRNSEGGVDRETHARTSERRAPKGKRV